LSGIVLGDDHEIIMDSLQYLIESESEHKVVGKCKTGQAFIEFINEDENKFDLAIIDVKLTDATGLELIAELKNRYVAGKCIFFSQFPDLIIMY